MNRQRRIGSSARALVVVALAVAATGLAAAPSRAMCDVIPGVTRAFRAALGTLNRPYAIPGDVAERLRLTLGTCDGASPSFGPMGMEDSLAVTVLFEPPNGTASAVVLHTAPGLCTAQAVTDCRAGLGSPSAIVDCRQVTAGTELGIVDSSTFDFVFPDTDDLTGGANDDRTLTGPATIVVHDANAPLPCALAATDCASCLADPASCGFSPGDLLSCVDTLYAEDGTCEISPALARLDPVFAHFTALPPANDFQAL